MSNARVTQQYAEVAIEPGDRNARVTQQYVEAAIEPGDRNARVTQQYVEVAVVDGGSRISPPLDMTAASPYVSSNIIWAADVPAGAVLMMAGAVSAESAIVDEAVGTGDGVAKVFYLDNYPVARLADLVVKIDGTITTAFTRVGRTMTFDAAPGDTLAITASYTGVDWPTTWGDINTVGDPIPGLVAEESLVGKHLWLQQTMVRASQGAPEVSMLAVGLDGYPPGETVFRVESLRDGKVSHQALEHTFDWQGGP